MARHAAPTALSRGKRRAAIAATAIAASAGMAMATPGAAQAAVTPSLDPASLLELGPEILIGLAPAIPGAIPVIAIPLVSPQIDNAVGQWNSSPLGQFITASNTTMNPGGAPEPIFFLSGGKFVLGLANSEEVKFLGPGGIGIGNTVSGQFTTKASLLEALQLAAALADGDFGALAGLDLASVVSNTTTLYGPSGSRLGLITALNASRVDGITTFTPTTGIAGVLPGNSGTLLFTVSPGSVTYGEGTFVIGGPSIGGALNAFGIKGAADLSLGRIGFADGKLVLFGPTLNSPDGPDSGTAPDNAFLTTPLGGVDGRVNGGGVELSAEDGLKYSGPKVSGGANAGGIVTANTDINTGSGSIDPDTGVDIDGPRGTVGGGITGVGSASGGVTNGGGVNLNEDDGLDVTGPTVGGTANVTGVGSVGSTTTTGEGGVDGDGDATLTGPTNTTTVTPAGGDTTAVTVSTGAVDTGDEDDPITPPDVTVDTDD